MHRRASISLCFAVFAIGGCATFGGGKHAPSKQVLRGGGLEVAVDLPGWSQVLGAGVLQGTYVRLAQFHAEPARDLSLLVDDAPTNALDELVANCVKGYRARGTVIILEREHVAGKAAAELTFVTHILPNVPRRELYIETLVAGKWLELHYSTNETSDALLRARADAEAIFASLTAQLVPGQPPDVTAADIREDDLALVGSLIRCPTQPQFFFCRALVAFRDGKRPDWSAQPRGFAGAALLIPASKGADDPELIVSEIMSFLVLGDHALAFGPLSGDNADEKRDATRVVDAIVAGQPIPARSSGVQYIAQLKATTPAAMTMRSLTWPRAAPNDRRGFVRETAMGLVVVMSQSGNWIVAVHPRP
ncbi:MAG TPA: hypothetical protein VIA18_11615 [Polyangia bacterium]|nr:hypothetical protein [Polyangia bacterium]